jgi:Holliday junction resolvasome RuvABC ATP-dependent DNA helicase subunit
MKKKQLYQVLALLVILNSPAAMLGNENPKLEAFTTVNMHIDNFDGLGKNVGKEASNIVKEIIIESISGAGEAINKAGNDKKLGKNLEQGFKGGTEQLADAFAKTMKNENIGNSLEEGLKSVTQQATNAFKKAMEDKELSDSIKAGTDAWASRVGDAAQSTQQGLEREVWPAMEKMSYQGIASFFNMKNAVQIGYPIALVGAVSITGYYGTRLAWKVLEKRMLDPRPDILLPGSKYGRWDRISRWRSGYQTPAMIFDAEIKDRLIEIKEKTKNIRDNIYNGRKTTYDNLLLYGKPGTGKTLFAQILADETNMDFLPVTAASLLQSGVEGIKYFNELLAMANRSKYGLIIFVDEADALFVDRDSLNPSSDHYKVLNHILALTGTGSNKFMLIAATNHAYVMDAAMGRRFQDRVLMPLPDATTRKELIDLYAGNVLFNAKNNSKEFVTAAQSLLTPQRINTIVKKTAELSHAEIKDMIQAMHKKALATKKGMITIAHVNSAVDQAVQKHVALEEDKAQREEHKTVTA